MARHTLLSCTAVGTLSILTVLISLAPSHAASTGQDGGSDYSYYALNSTSSNGIPAGYGLADGESLEVAFVQPQREDSRELAAAAQTPPAPRSRDYSRLASVPQMFGDFFGNYQLVTETFITDLPLAGGSRRVKVAENNRALTADRVFFTYNHFENALSANSPVQSRDFSVDRYVVGFEKRLLDGDWSADVRMPFTGGFEFVDPLGPNVTGGEIGNLSVILKRQFWTSSTTAFAAGVGFDLPTGSDVRIGEPGNDFRLHNDAVHLLPYLGFSTAYPDGWFFNGFAQLDLALNGNRVDTLGQTVGRFNEQNLLYLDGAAGYWLYQNPCARGFTGLAGIVELHYTTTLQDADTVAVAPLPQPGLPPTNSITNRFNRFDILNLSAGLHTQIGDRSNLRVAAVVPLRLNNQNENGVNIATDRFFDAEVIVQFNRSF